HQSPNAHPSDQCARGALGKRAGPFPVSFFARRQRMVCWGFPVVSSFASPKRFPPGAPIRSSGQCVVLYRDASRQAVEGTASEARRETLRDERQSWDPAKNRAQRIGLVQCQREARVPRPGRQHPCSLDQRGDRAFTGGGMDRVSEEKDPERAAHPRRLPARNRERQTMEKSHRGSQCPRHPENDALLGGRGVGERNTRDNSPAGPGDQHPVFTRTAFTEVECELLPRGDRRELPSPVRGLGQFQKFAEILTAAEFDLETGESSGQRPGQHLKDAKWSEGAPSRRARTSLKQRNGSLVSGRHETEEKVRALLAKPLL